MLSLNLLVVSTSNDHLFQLTKVIETLNEQLTKKGTEINEYKEKFNIHIRGQDDVQRQEESKEAKRNAVVINPIQV